MSRVYMTRQQRRAAEERRVLEKFDDRTLFRVVSALRDSGLSIKQIIDALDALQTAGIVFRERIEQDT